MELGHPVDVLRMALERIVVIVRQRDIEGREANNQACLVDDTNDP
jgi:hypothetical protein